MSETILDRIVRLLRHKSSTRALSAASDTLSNIDPLEYSPLLKDFLRRSGISSQSQTFTFNHELDKAVCVELNKCKIDLSIGSAEHTRQRIYGASYMTEHCFPHHAFHTKVVIAIFTFFVFHFDDYSESNPNAPAALLQFEKSIVLGGPTRQQLEPRFDFYLNYCLAKMPESFGSYATNAILTAAFGHINATFLETQAFVRDGDIRSETWPYHLRSSTGVSIPYAHFIFPDVLFPNIEVYLQAIPDLMRYVDLTNDLLSFHKEELAGERSNYIHNRAKATGQSVVGTLKETSREIFKVRKIIMNVLNAHPTALASWTTFERGYIDFHLGHARYKLGELKLF